MLCDFLIYDFFDFIFNFRNRFLKNYNVNMFEELLYIFLLCNFERKVLFELFVWNEYVYIMYLYDEIIFCRVDYLLIGSL